MEEIIFPNQIRMIRRTRGKTMKEIAGILGVSLSAISKIEKGYRRIDEEQLNKISTFLDCPKESIFVYEKTSQPEVLQAWQKEQDRRKQINEKSGLKTLGAGLRYIRGEKMLTLQDVAKGAGLTLSVYHRIEMGQREVTEDQFKKIAHALGFTAETLQIQIYELDMAGTLQEFKKTGKPGIFHPKGGYNDLPLKSTHLHLDKKVPVLTVPGSEKIAELDISFHQPENLYGLVLEGSLFGLNRNVTALVSKQALLQAEDAAIYVLPEKGVVFGFVIEENGKLTFKAKDSSEKVDITDENKSSFNKVISISFE